MGSGGEAIDVYGYELGDFLRVRDGMTTGIIDRQGNRIIDLIYTEIYYDERNEEIFLVRTETEADDDYIIETAVVDKNGEILVPLAEYQEL